MRTHEFEFKKTVKRTQKFKAISVDLTVSEAREVLERLEEGSEDYEGVVFTPEELAVDALRRALSAFLDNNK